MSFEVEGVAPGGQVGRMGLRAAYSELSPVVFEVKIRASDYKDKVNTKRCFLRCTGQHSFVVII